METSQITNRPDAGSTATRRSRRRLELDAARAATKRKRVDEKDRNEDDDDDDDELSDPPELSDAENGVNSTTEEDGPTPKPKKKKLSKKTSKAKRPRKPAAKRVKTNGTLAGTVELVSRPKEHRIQAEVDPDRLFGMRPLATHPLPTLSRVLNANPAALPDQLFDKHQSAINVAEAWFNKYQEDEVAALTGFVNFILEAAGCDPSDEELRLTENDIRDPENAPNRLNELQGEHQEVRCPWLIEGRTSMLIALPSVMSQTIPSLGEIPGPSVASSRSFWRRS